VWQAQLGASEARLTLTQRFQMLSGTLSVSGREEALTDARMTGDRITFAAGGRTFAGRVTTDAIAEGTIREAQAPPVPWSARRVR
jgi:hypothetical protein